MDIKTIILDLIKADSMQDFLNKRYQDPSKVILPRNYYKFIENEHGRFRFDEHVVTIDSADHDYDISDMRPDDIVLDIGACIGAFALKAAKRCKHVYAVEPITTDLLRETLKMNDAKNITVLDYSLGLADHNFMGLPYQNNLSHKKKTLPELIAICGGHVDFIKCDCEGGEWVIKPEDLAGVRRLEAEIHYYKGQTPQLQEFRTRLDNAGFSYTYNVFTLYKTLMLIHARHKTVEQWASKERLFYK